MFQLPKRTHLVHKAIEPHNLSASTLAVVQARHDDLWEVKYDGCCGILLKAGGKAYGWSRQGEVIAGAMDRQLRAMEALCSDDFVMFVEGWSPNLPFNIINGDFRRGYKEGEPRTLMAVVFDMVPLHEFMAGIGTKPFLDRTSQVSRFVCNLDEVAPPGLFISAAQFTCKGDAVDYVAERQDAGEVHPIDGFMRKARMGVWTAGAGSCGTSVKDKAKFTVDLKVVALVEGKGKFLGMLGAYECTYKGAKQLVGGGKLTTKERKAIWADQTRAEGGIGSIIEVAALGESSNGLLREPRFSRYRLDKSEGE